MPLPQFLLMILTVLLAAALSLLAVIVDWYRLAVNSLPEESM